ncbi:MAG TPA: NUDIX hydrolase [Blastocatellia bacterium]|jgi:ADP-ribose pyrophosphatase YjhB (NUDIX family)
MLKKVLGALWRRSPAGLRRLSVRLSQSRFTVTTAAVIVDKDDRILLLKHVFRVGSGWGIPGGFMNKGEQPEAALRREVHEEMGLELDSVELAFVRALKKSAQVEIYFRASPRGASEPRSVEIKSAEWFKLDELPESLSHDQREIIEGVLSATA